MTPRSIPSVHLAIRQDLGRRQPVLAHVHRRRRELPSNQPGEFFKYRWSLYRDKLDGGQPTATRRPHCGSSLERGSAASRRRASRRRCGHPQTPCPRADRAASTGHAAAEVLDHREHAPVAVAGVVDVELLEDVLDVTLDGLRLGTGGRRFPGWSGPRRSERGRRVRGRSVHRVGRPPSVL